MNDNIVNFWENIAILSVGIVTSMIGFWFTIGKNIVSKNDICEMIETKGPYMKDSQFIMERLSVNKETQAALSVTLQKVIEVMSELKVQIATLGKTLEALEERIDRQNP